MDFDDTQEEAAFRAEVRAWLASVAKPKADADGPGVARRYRPKTEEDDASFLEHAKAWQRTVVDAGYGGVHWPVSHGGRGLPAGLATIVEQERAHFDVPGNAFMVGIDMAGPTLMAHGSPDQQSRWLPGTLRGETVWCQLFSEPGAGSDLAGLSTRATRDGDGWRVNGQKVWTSGAHYSDVGMLLARTNPDVPKHAGITFFVVDMDTPGITVRPLRQIDGAIHFNEVFLDDVFVPDDRVVGAVDEGWKVARTTLTAERTAIGGGGMSRFDDVAALARRCGATGDPHLRQELARVYTRAQLQRWLVYRVRTAAARRRCSSSPTATRSSTSGASSSSSRARPGCCGTTTPSTGASGRTASCRSGRAGSAAGPSRSSGTSSPSGCWGYRESPTWHDMSRGGRHDPAERRFSRLERRS